MSKAITRPALRYHGGKWNMAPFILKHFPAHRIYAEPFGGGASVLIRKSRSYAEVYNDLDGEIVNVFKVLRDNGANLMQLLELTPFSRAEYTEAAEPSTDPVEQARRTIVKSFMGFGSDAIRSASSGFRANAKRQGTTPSHDWANYAQALPALVARLQGTVIECRDYRKIIETHDTADTLFYVDPPYVHSTRESAKRYNFEMTDEDHRELARILHEVRGKVVLSGYDCELYRELYADWQATPFSALADGARPRIEMLWTNFMDHRMDFDLATPSTEAGEKRE